jgi:glycosyltransferase involved in cell wall biosynthesis
VKLLWFSHFVPYPPRGGNAQRSFNLIRQASRSFEVHLLALNLQNEPARQIQAHETELKTYCRTVDICELPFRWRGFRWWTKAACSPLFRDPFSCRSLLSTKALARWRHLLSAHSGALVHFDSIDLALYVDSARAFKKVLNHHNCESAMTARLAQNEPNPIKRKYLAIQAAKLRHAERTLCGEFNANLVVSEPDRRLLEAIQPKGKYTVVENGVDTSYFAASSSATEPRSLIFTGQLHWGPNVSAMRFLVEQVWPNVKRRFPDARLYLAGRNPPEIVRRWSKEDPAITVVPNPEDMRPWLGRAAICVCPVLEGGGTRLKILDAMATGKPVVSTSVGCEGLRVTPGDDILIADAAADFSARIVELFESRELRSKIGAAGRRLVEREYSWERIGQQLEAAYNCALLPQLRPEAEPRGKTHAST